MTNATCDYYGNTGTNMAGSYCQNPPTWDLGRYLQKDGIPYEARYACDDHASRLVPWKYRKNPDDPHRVGQ